MTRPYISQKEFLEVAHLFQWATRDHYVLWFYGKPRRSKRVEVLLPRLVKKGKLVSRWYGKKLIYSVPRKRMKKYGDFYDPNIEHELACTEGLVRLALSKPNCEIIKTGFFFGFGVVPEWGIKYSTGKMLLFEFCTADNFYRKLRSKIARYKEVLPAIEERFGCSSVVLFVLDVERERVRAWLDFHKIGNYPFLFTDYKTFLEVPFRRQLSTPIYFWGGDGQAHPLVKDDGSITT